MISDRFVFIHIPKTGGQFFREVVSRLKIPHHEFGDRSVPLNLRYHQALSELPTAVTKDRFVFGFVRNPLTWVVSRWAWNLQRKGPDFGQMRFDQGHRDSLAFVRKDFSEYLDLMLAHRPNTPTIEMWDKLTGTKNIYRFEELQPSIVSILRKLGYPVPPSFLKKILRKNVSNEKPTLTRDQEEQLRAANADMFRHFGY